MSLPLATLSAAASAIIANRILAVLVGLWFKVPTGLLLGVLIVLDILQIPIYYWLYDHGAALLERLPVSIRSWFKQDGTLSHMGRWAAHLGGFGVMLIAAMPTFGGGMWSAVFMAYQLRLNRAVSYSWITLGSVISYLGLYWILGTLVMAVRFFVK